MCWSNNTEVPTVEGCNRVLVEPFGQHDHASICAAEWEIGIGVDKFGDATEIVVCQRVDQDGPTSDRSEEAGFGLGADPPTDEVRGFSDHQ